MQRIPGGDLAVGDVLAGLGDALSLRDIKGAGASEDAAGGELGFGCVKGFVH